MKKIFATAILALLVITSCSDDRTPNTGDANVVLLKKIIEQQEDGSIVTSFYEYDGTKLLGISQSDGNGANYSYTGDQVTKVEYIENNAVARWADLMYDAEGRVAEMILYGYDEVPGEEGEETVQITWADRTTYTHNGDGTISLVMYTGDHESQTEITDEGTLTVTDGNVTAYSSASGNSTYTFDAGHNPEGNILGMNPLNVAMQYGGVNNITAASYSNGSAAYSATYTYNSDNYPVSAVAVEGGVTTNIWFMY